MENYINWQKNVQDKKLKKELESLKGNTAEIENRFHSYLEFGTAGLRGLIGVGTNCLNIYTIAKATKALANFINAHFTNASVIITYDNRMMSKQFASLASQILCANNITVHLFKELTPTPVLSYAIRKLHTTFGINITASHNPKEYNGYKVFNQNGIQIGTIEAKEIADEMQKIDEFNVDKISLSTAKKKGLLHLLDRTITNDFLNESFNTLRPMQTVSPLDSFKFIYSPLNGTGYYSATSLFKKLGFTNYIIPSKQKRPSPYFATCPYPNPEFVESFNESMKLTKTFDADILLANDPDADRVGALAKHKGEYIKLTGNELGLIMLNYLIEYKKQHSILSKNSFVVSSIVSTPLTKVMCDKNNIKFFGVLTGFKYIGSKVDEEINKSSKEDFIFAFEESSGYMLTSNIRDKGAISPTGLICIIANELKAQNKTLIDYLDDIYQTYGYIKTENKSITITGMEGIKKIQNTMTLLRGNQPSTLGGKKIVQILDYETGVNGLEKSNVLEYQLQGNFKLIIRPSGTEPKLKMYYTTTGNSLSDTNNKMKTFMSDIDKFLDTLMK